MRASPRPACERLRVLRARCRVVERLSLPSHCLAAAGEAPEADDGGGVQDGEGTREHAQLAGARAEGREGVEGDLAEECSAPASELPGGKACAGSEDAGGDEEHE